MTGLTRRAAALLLGSAGAALATGAEAKPGPRDAFEALAQSWRKDLAAEGVVGGSLVVARHGRVLGLSHHGLADQASARPVTTETLWHWASITKVFTAVALLQLRDRGLLALDDPAVRYVPELAAVHNRFGPIEQITLRRLLSHSAGLRGATFPWGGDQPWQPHEPQAWSQVEAMFPYTEVEFEPGSRFGYSNLGLSVLGRVIETVAHEGYEAHVEKFVLRPLGMRESYFGLTPAYLLGRRANNYERDKAGVLKTNGLEVETGATVANGGLNGPILDLLKYTDFLLATGDTRNHVAVLSRATLSEMTAPGLSVDDSAPNPTRIGLGFFVVDHARPGGGPPERFFGHAGHQLGFHSLMQVHPRTGAAIIAVGNTNRRGGNSWPANLRDGFYDRFIPALGA